MSQPRLTREPEDGRIERWLAERRHLMPTPDRDGVLERALHEVPRTPQRRRQRLLRWLPFGIGAARTSIPAEPRVTGSTRMILSATRMAALVAVVLLGGSLALVAGPFSPDPASPGSPAAVEPGPEAAGWFSGSGGITMIEGGDYSEVDGVTQMRGQITQVPARLVSEVDDPRMGGTQTFTQHVSDFGGFGPTWGTLRIEDADGVWFGDVAGTWSAAGTRFSGWLIGDGAYEHLVAYYQADVPGAEYSVRFSGVIYPAAQPPVGSELSQGGES